MNSPRARPLLVAGALGMLTLGIGGCGSSHSSSRTTAASVTPAGTTQITATTATTAAPGTAPTPAARLRILAPRPLAQLDQTVAVHVSVTGAVGTGSRSFRYVLDGRLYAPRVGAIDVHGRGPRAPSPAGRVGLTSVGQRDHRLHRSRSPGATASPFSPAYDFGRTATGARTDSVRSFGADDVHRRHSPGTERR